MHDYDADAALVGQGMQTTNGCIVGLILAVSPSRCWPYRRQRIDDQQARVGRRIDPRPEGIQTTIVETRPLRREVKPLWPGRCVWRDPRHPVLQAAVVV